MTDRIVRCLVPALLVLSAACSLPADPPPQIVVTPVPGNEEVRSARDLLGEPVVALLRAAAAAHVAIDSARHVAPRGDAQVHALVDADAALAELERARTALADALASLPAMPANAPASRGEAVARAAAAGELMVTESARMIEVVRRTAAPLRDLLALDDRMDAVVTAWDAAGSRSERAAALEALLPQALALEPDARRIDLWPPGCTTLRVNRLAWAELLAARTAALREAAAEGLGETYDTLRARYRLAPYGEDRAVADSQDRACWERTAGLSDALAVLQEQAEEIGRALG